MLGDTIAAFKTGTYTVTRTPAETFVDGFPVAGVPTTFPIEASIRPVSGRSLRRPAEGQYGDEVVRVRTTTAALLTRGPGQVPDRIAYKGEVYEVFRVRENTHGAGWHALASRLETP